MCDKGLRGDHGLLGCVLNKARICEENCEECIYSYNRRFGFEKIPMVNHNHGLYYGDLVINRGYKIIDNYTDFSKIFENSNYAIGYYCIDHVNKKIWIDYQSGEPKKKCNLEDISVTINVNIPDIIDSKGIEE